MAEQQGPFVVFVAVFDDEDKGEKARVAIESLENKSLMMNIVDAISVTHHKNGKVKMKQWKPGAGKRAKQGALIWGITGLIFPPTILVSAGVGAAVGGAWGKMQGKGLKGGKVKDAGEQLQPGRSAVVIVTGAEHLEVIEAMVPSAIRTANHQFDSTDSGEIERWLGSLSATEGSAGTEA
jgi:uncharacterized membrane protein